MASPLEACVRILGDLIAFPTVSRDPNRELLAYVEAWLARHGVGCEILWNEERTKGNLWATIGPPDVPGVILSGHSDVVPVDGQAWTGDPFALREADGRLYGRGACDMKGFIAVVLAAVPRLVALGLKAPVHIAVSYDEEVGCTGVVSLIERVAGLPVRPALCIVGEPTGMGVVVGQKGGGMFRITIEGRSAHSSLAPSAVNAIEYGTELILLLRSIAHVHAERGPRDHGFDVAHSTLSITTIAGGTALNIIPGRCEIGFDIRALPEVDVDALVARIADHAATRTLPRMRERAPEAAIRIERVAEFVGLGTPPEHPAVRFVKRLAGRNDHGMVAYGTEAGLFSRDAGVVSVVCGPGSIEQAHKPDEFIELAELDRCRLFVDRLADALVGNAAPWA